MAGGYCSTNYSTSPRPIKSSLDKGLFVRQRGPGGSRGVISPITDNHVRRQTNGREDLDRDGRLVPAELAAATVLAPQGYQFTSAHDVCVRWAGHRKLKRSDKLLPQSHHGVYPSKSHRGEPSPPLRPSICTSAPSLEPPMPRSTDRTSPIYQREVLDRRYFPSAQPHLPLPCRSSSSSPAKLLVVTLVTPSEH